jgi:hypothetical protein
VRREDAAGAGAGPVVGNHGDAAGCGTATGCGAAAFGVAAGVGCPTLACACGREFGVGRTAAVRAPCCQARTCADDGAAAPTTATAVMQLRSRIREGIKLVAEIDPLR